MNMRAKILNLPSSADTAVHRRVVVHRQKRRT